MRNQSAQYSICNFLHLYWEMLSLIQFALLGWLYLLPSAFWCTWNCHFPINLFLLCSSHIAHCRLLGALHVAVDWFISVPIEQCQFPLQVHLLLLVALSANKVLIKWIEWWIFTWSHRTFLFFLCDNAVCFAALVWFLSHTVHSTLFNWTHCRYFSALLATVLK